MAYAFLHIVDVVVQREMALRQRHQAGVHPVGDVDLVVFEHGFYGVTQQCGVVARERRDDQHHRLVFDGDQGVRVVRQALKAQKIAKRTAPLGALVDRDLDAVDLDRAQAKFGLFVVLGQAVHELIAGGHALGKRALGQGRDRVGERFGREIGQIGERLHQCALGLVKLVKHAAVL